MYGVLVTIIRLQYRGPADWWQVGMTPDLSRHRQDEELETWTLLERAKLLAEKIGKTSDGVLGGFCRDVF